jgi:hypothetical protein
MRLDNVAISALRAKLDNSKMSLLPWRVVQDTVYGDTYVSIETQAGGIAEAMSCARINFDGGHAELAVAAVNALPALLDRVEALQTGLAALRDQLYIYGKRSVAERIDALLNPKEEP